MSLVLMSRLQGQFVSLKSQQQQEEMGDKNFLNYRLTLHSSHNILKVLDLLFL